MKALKDFKTKKLNSKKLSHVNGGDGKTSYTTSAGDSGTDCYSDDDNSGGLSTGDGVLLDNGIWIVKQ